MVKRRRMMKSAIVFGLLSASGAQADTPQPDSAVEHLWKQGDPVWYAGKADRIVCYLGGVGGKFKGFGEAVSIKVVNGVWQVSGSSNQQDVSAWIDCEPLYLFKQNAPKKADIKYWLSDRFTLNRTGGGDCMGPATKLAWQGDAATFITGMTGSFRGRGERITVNQANIPDGASSIQVTQCSPQVGMSAYSLFVGIPHSSQPLTFVGPNTWGGSSEQAGEFVSIPNGDVKLPPLNTAMCYFTEISGTFNGGGEYVRINGNVLEARHASGQGTFAKVRCVRYN